MSTMRRSLPLIKEGCRSLASRNFHSTPVHQANIPIRRSPRVAPSGASRPSVRQVKQTYDIEESLPPIILLNSAKNSGALTVEPENALDFLRQYQQLAGKYGAGWEQKLCAEYDITPATMALLAGILRRCEGKAQKSLAKKVMLSASDLGEKSATFEIISSALRSGSLQEYQTPLYRLGHLAKKDQDPQAMTLMGKIMLARQSEKESLEWFRKATQPPTGSLEFYGSGEALVNEGRILLKQNDKKEAEVAFRKAALELDEPSAYFYLSQLQEPGSFEQEVYLLKAASSGVIEACHNLGALELAKVEERPQEAGVTRNYKMATEWFQVAAVDGFGLSMLNLALIFKASGQNELGLEWLEKAEEIVEVRDQAQAVRRNWSDAGIGITI